MNKRIVIEVEVGGVTIRRENTDPWWGDNPLHHAKEFAEAVTKEAEEVERMLAKHFGDIREIR